MEKKRVLRISMCEICKKYTPHEITRIRYIGNFVIGWKICQKHKNAEEVYYEIDIYSFNSIP